jgi:hypothetical protein
LEIGVRIGFALRDFYAAEVGLKSFKRLGNRVLAKMPLTANFRKDLMLSFGV